MVRCSYGPLISVALLGVGLLLSATAGTAEPAHSDSLSRLEVEKPTLSIDPASWLLNSGNRSDFSAVWTNVPVECFVRATSSVWRLDGGGIEGTLNQTLGPLVEFDAWSTVSGVTNLTLRSNLDLQCGGADRTISSEATGQITVIGPLALDAATVLPDPVRPGTPVEANVTISGGLPPYSLTLYRGLGAPISVNSSHPGPVSIRSIFPNGSSLPRFEVVDRQGTNRVLVLGEPVYVSSAFAVAIRSESDTADDGIPFNLSSELAGGVPPYSYLWELTTREEFFTAAIQPTFSGVTGVAILLSVRDSAGNRTDALESIHVVPPVQFNASFSIDSADVGVPVPLRCEIDEGVGPFLLQLVFPGYDGDRSIAIPVKGISFQELQFTSSGQILGMVRVTDSDGATASSAVTLDAVEPLVNATVSVTESDNSSGARFSVGLEVIAGVPPFAWDLGTAAASEDSDPTVGTLAISGPFVWHGVFPVEGNLTIHLEVIDSLGGTTNVSWSGEALSPLRVNTSVVAGGNSASDPVLVLGMIDGGLAPYRFWFGDSSGDTSTGNASASGNVTWQPTSVPLGTFRAWFRCIDALGVAANSTASSTVRLPPPLPNRANNSTSPVQLGTEIAPILPPGIITAASVAIPVAVALGVGAFYWRRRAAHRHSPKDTDGEAHRIVSRLLLESDGLDRETLELLAADEGVPEELIRTTIDRGVHENRWRQETGDDGIEFLRLIPAPSTEALPERDQTQ